MKIHNCSFYFVFILFISCQNESKRDVAGKKEHKEFVINEEKKADPVAVQALYRKLHEVHIPTKINIGNENDSLWQVLGSEQMHQLFPEYNDSSETKAYAVGRISFGKLKGILYYFSSPTPGKDETEPQEIKTIDLFLYNGSFEFVDALNMATSDYGSGWTLFRSADDISYFYSSEMEFINLEIVKHRIRENKFEEAGEKVLKEFSGEKYYEKYEVYIKKLEEDFVPLDKM